MSGHLMGKTKVVPIYARREASIHGVLSTGQLSFAQTDALRKLQVSDERFDFWRDAQPEKSADIMSSPEHLDELKALLDRYNLNWESYGSHDDFNEFIDEIAAENSAWARTKSIGKSGEGRDMRVLELTKGGPGAPNIFIEAGIHAREWIAPAVATYTVMELIENYEAHPEYLDNFNWHVLPSANPDGYEFSRSSDRLWRKNRGDNQGSLCKGVDLNRNWGFHWAESGVSDSPCSDVFCGTEAFSEIESQNTRDYFGTINPLPEISICFHSAANLWLYPYGYAYDSYPDNVDEVRRLGEDAVDALNAVDGQSFECINSAELYPAAGASDDYYASLGSRFVYTPELRDNGFGFVLPPQYIIPSGKEVWAAWESASVDCVIAPAIRDQMLISWHHLRELGLLSDSFPSPSVRVVRMEDSVGAIESDFADVFGNTLKNATGRMKRNPMNIQLREDVPIEPLHVNVACPVPLHLAPMARVLMNELFEAGTLAPVTEPTEWGSPGHFILKAYGTIGVLSPITVD
eukprot:maker-scaffold239_size242058-snap-gene-1.25 protein:Tk09816 transcript:maker-scaffold239_size242058-snap-gene-1.25-mRNA-1 annotation:"carboxypeptidase b"